MFKAALIGEKLVHSYSPLIHQLFFEEMGIKGKYELVEIKHEKFAKTISKIMKKFDGLNITLPYKESVIPFLFDGNCLRSVNTVVKCGKKYIGRNTDYEGFKMMLHYYGVKTLNRKWVILGTGGVSKMVHLYAKRCRPKKIVVISRSPNNFKKNTPFLNQFSKTDFWDYNDLYESKEHDLLVNCTPVGMFPDNDSCPLKGVVVSRFNTVIDLVYNPHPTKLVKKALKGGKQGIDGLYMLVSQAVLSECLWHGEKYSPKITDKIYEKLLMELK